MTTQQTAPEQQAPARPPRSPRKKPTLRQRLRKLRVKGRRAAQHTFELLLRSRQIGPVAFLSASAVLGTVLTVTTLFTPCYAVYVDGQKVGLSVADQSTVEAAVATVEARSTRRLGYSYTVDNEITYHFSLALRSELAGEEDFEDLFSTRMDDVAEDLRQYEVSVNGRSVGVIESKTEFNRLLERLKADYQTEGTTSVEFVDTIELLPTLVDEGEVISIEEMYARLTENTTGETTYEVASGDTFGAIAYRNDMSVAELKKLNPGVNIDRLSVGQKLNVKEQIPLLSVRTTEVVTYNEAVPCPVEKRDNASMYKGTTKIRTQGVEGEARVTAQVTRVNGIEKDRQILSTVNLRSPTTTVMEVGTKEKPKTASTGKYKWPCRGSITSYFGYRKIFGSRSYHSGIDIAGAYGTTVKAADGGKVTFAGYKGNYGYLVIITHDNGTQTYYGHNSSLLVSAGTKVYQGQAIAKMGSTGRSTGNHCHFEVRVGGKAVNPLSYLK
ncbi:MAG: peptidoglycan DD-metalloendopeptidase family protein [Oscillospiraceae bacterium]|nr:peptidoglycan DD-metalloendopeptidase family protein [Oscillospiraceae bacterium]